MPSPTQTPTASTRGLLNRLYWMQSVSEAEVDTLYREGMLTRDAHTFLKSPEAPVAIRRAILNVRAGVLR